MSDAPAPVTEPVATPEDNAEALRIGATLIRQFEGCTLQPVPDTQGHWQIGYGCNFLPDGTPVTKNTPPLTDISEAEAMLQSMLAVVAEDVDREVTVWLPPHARGALYSFVWNEGIGAFGCSTMLRLINAGDTQAAADEFPKWVYADGQKLTALVKRRAVERAVFLRQTTL